MKDFIRKLKIKFVMNFLQHEMATLDQYWFKEDVERLLKAYNDVLVDLQYKKEVF